MISVLRLLNICSILTISILWGGAVNARNVFEDVWGVVTDPLKLGKSSENISESIQRSLIQLQSMEGLANAHVEQRLEQIRSIVNEALSGGSDAVSKALTQINQLEDKINQDAVNLIYRAQCAAETAATDTMQRSFEAFIGKIVQSNPRVTIFGIVVARAEVNKVSIVDADKAYRSTRDAVLNELKSNTSDKSTAYDILSAYQNIELGAKYARCHYMGQSLEVKFTQEINEWERKSLPWISVVSPKM